VSTETKVSGCIELVSAVIERGLAHSIASSTRLCELAFAFFLSLASLVKPAMDGVAASDQDFIQRNCSERLFVPKSILGISTQVDVMRCNHTHSVW